MELSSPLVSILIPNYNKASYLRETLESVRSQTYQNWECVIIDDHSTDESCDILREFSAMDERFKVFRRPDHLKKGGNICRNYAFQVSNGEYVNWFDSDDLMNTKMLENRVEALTNNRHLDYVVFAGQKFRRNIGDFLGLNGLIFDDEPDLCSFIKIKPSWITPSCMFTRDFLKKNEIYWDEEVHILQDVLFNFNVLFYSKIFMIFPTVDWYWRLDKSSGSVGSKRNSMSNLNSFKHFIVEISKKVDVIQKYRHCFGEGAVNLIKTTSGIYGLKWFRGIVMQYYKCGLFNFWYLLLLFVILLISQIFRLFSVKYFNLSRSAFIKVFQMSVRYLFPLLIFI